MAHKLGLGDRLHVHEHDLDCAEDDRAVGVLELRHDALTDMLGLALVCGAVFGECVEDRDAPPLGALVERDEQLGEQLRVEHEDAGRVASARLARSLLDVRECGDRVCDDHWVAVRHHVLDAVDEAPLVRELGLEGEELCDADHRGLAHVRVLVMQAAVERVGQVVDDLFRAQAAHCADRERADERVWVLRVLDECVDREDHELGLCLGVVYEVEVDELLLLDVLRLHVLEHVGEECGHVLADGHVGNHALDRVLAAVAILAVDWSVTTHAQHVARSSRPCGAP